MASLETYKKMGKYYSDIQSFRGKASKGFSLDIQSDSVVINPEGDFTRFTTCQGIKRITLKINNDTKFYKKVYKYVSDIQHNDETEFDYELYFSSRGILEEEKYVKVNNDFGVNITIVSDMIEGKTTFEFGIIEL